MKKIYAILTFIGYIILIIIFLIILIIFFFRIKIEQFLSFISPAYRRHAKRREEKSEEQLKKATENRGWAFQDLR
jgi:TRAP-type C4-dicarboxylate transport system permease small subunit